MFSNFLTWLLSVILAFNLGAGVASREATTEDNELKQKVQDHLDVIVDEAAGLVDDVLDDVRQNEKVQEAEAFVEDVKDIMRNTLDDIDAHFGTEDEEAETAEEAAEEAAEETAEETTKAE
ncbi:MAG: hypothetical protein IJ229_02845 [Clostridia bacterium]|nr:hypothetical protein [Clostridia bacterium]